MSDYIQYHLVHVLAYQEYNTPLVRTQLFEQAKVQVELKSDNAPLSVEVWIVVPFRSYWDTAFKTYLNELRNSYPKLKIRVIGGVDRIANFPQSHLLYFYRRNLGMKPVIFHFRGEDLISRFIWLKKFFNKDKLVADIRGLWPAEFLLNQQIEVNSLEELASNPSAKILLDRMQENLKFADGLSTVNSKLGDAVSSLSEFDGPKWVVPCAISNYKRNGIPIGVAKSESSEYQIGYLGGTASYQNLPELVFPFMDVLMSKDSRVNFLIVTHEKEKMAEMIRQYHWDSKRVRLISVSQKEVHECLKNLDLGLMIRRSSLVNRVAQPVKIGEYLAAGVPVLIQKGLGGLRASEYPGLIELDFEKLSLEEAAAFVLNYLQTESWEKRSKSALTSAERLLWENHIPTHRHHYQILLNQ